MSAQSTHPLNLFPLSEADLSSLSNWISGIAVGFLLLGVHATFCASTIYVFLTRPAVQSKARNRLIALTCYMLSSSFVSGVIKMEFNLLRLPSFGSPSGQQLTHVVALRTGILMTNSVLDRVNYIVGDIIVVWRAWILFPGNLKIKMLLVLCLIASCAGVFINGGRVIAYELKNLDASVPATNVLILAMPLFFTNLVVTVLIGYKTWMYQQDIRKNLINTSGSGPRLQKILLLLIESGMIYCILWMLDGLLGFSSTSSSISTRVLGSAMPNLAGIYPNLIILIAMLEYTQPANLEETSLSQSLRFATSASESESTSSSGRVRLRDSSIRVGSRRAREGGWESDGTNVVTNSAVEEENC